MEEQFIASDNVKNRKFSSFPYFNLYISRDHVVVVPVMGRGLHITSAISGTLLVFMIVSPLFTGQPVRLSTLVLLGLIFGISWPLSYLLKSSRIKRLRSVSLQEIMRQKGFAAPRNEVEIKYLANHALIQLGSKSVQVTETEGKKLERVLGRS